MENKPQPLDPNQESTFEREIVKRLLEKTDELEGVPQSVTVDTDQRDTSLDHIVATASVTKGTFRGVQRYIVTHQDYHKGPNRTIGIVKKLTSSKRHSPWVWLKGQGAYRSGKTFKTRTEAVKDLFWCLDD